MKIINADNLPWILVVLLLVWAAYTEFVRKPHIVHGPGEVVVDVVTDTLWMPADTIRVPGPIQHVEIEVPVPVIENDTVFVYTQKYEDRFLSATFSARTTGQLLSWDFTYRPFIPHITLRTTVRETRTVLVPQYYQHSQRYRTELLLGLGGSLDGVEAVGGISRNRYQYQYGYNPIDNTHRITVLRKFSF